MTILTLTKVDVGMLEDVGTSANDIIQLDSNAKIPAVDGSLLTGTDTALSASSDPTISTNPTNGVGTKYRNTTSGEMYICTDATAGANVWKNVGAGSGDIQNTSWLGNRGLFTGGQANSGADTNMMDYITISTAGNATDFGDLTVARGGAAALTGNSSARGVTGGGEYENVIDYVTIATTGNSTDFGDRLNSARFPASCSNGVRGVWAGGYIASPAAMTNVIDYITVASTGNAVDFGDMTLATEWRAGLGNSTRGIIAGGYPGVNAIDYITIASVGNALDFGDLTVGRNAMGACGSTTRGLFMGSSNPNSNTIDYITIGTLGNALDFGDLITAITRMNVCCSNNTRAVSAGNYPSANIIEYVTIDTLGNSIDFGDLVNGSYGVGKASCSGD